jgi:hypothetical protein
LHWSYFAERCEWALRKRVVGGSNPSAGTAVVR